MCASMPASDGNLGTPIAAISPASNNHGILFGALASTCHIGALRLYLAIGLND
jgi:hypothetical protein